MNASSTPLGPVRLPALVLKRVRLFFVSEALIVTVAMLAFACHALAGFDPNCNGRVFAIALQEDGGILIGGEFTSVGGTPRYKIARLHPDGSVDPTFNAGMD